VTGGRQQSLALCHPTDAPVLSTRADGGALPLHPERTAHLWICLYFNRLPIEVIGNSNKNEPFAVVHDSGRQAGILLCNDVAAGFGVRAGMRINAARALIADLKLATRNVARERQALERLAAWAIRYTPAVSLDREPALLLEVRASLKIFGGLPALRRRIIAELDGQPYRAILSSATTAVAAMWLARAGRAEGQSDVPASNDSDGVARLGNLPVECFGWPGKTVQMLAQMGVRTFGECVRLPRNGFARRIGAQHLGELDRALGRQPEVHEFYRPPKYFRSRLDLPAESSDAGQLLESARRVLRKLDAFLLRHQGGVEVLWIRLSHFNRSATLQRIALMQVAMESSSLLELIRLHFAELKFAAPVIALTIETRLVPSVAPGGADLFGDYVDSRRPELDLFDRLRARLGANAVHGIRSVSEHRPELAWEAINPGDRGSQYKNRRCIVDRGKSGLRRPLWVLDQPQLLRLVSGKLVFHDALNLEDGPERIETGWWDGKDIRRDYYIARNGSGARLWVFKDHRASHWYLHGLFA